MDDYDRSKILAEKITHKYVDSGMVITTLYPTVVYGAGELKEWNLATKLIRIHRRGWMPGLIEGGLQQWNFVHVEDVVAGHLAAMRRTQPEQYLLGGENVLLRDFLSIVAGALHRRPPRLKVPLRLARMWASLEEAAARWAKREPLVGKHTVEILARSWAFSSSKAERELNYRARPLAPALKEFVEWLVERH